MSVNTASAKAYEQHAESFLQRRDKSPVGIRVTNRWARSLRPGAEVIEIACGGGLPVSKTLVDAGLRLWAIDSSPTLLTAFKSRFPNTPTECATVLESDYFQRKFDAAIAIGLIFLLSEKDQLQMLQKVSGILNPGASFMFTAPIETGTWTDTGTGHRCTSLGQHEYENALSRSGFQATQCFEDSGKNNYYEALKGGSNK